MSGELILIVDDEELIRRKAQEAVRLNGYRTLTAGSGAEALEKLEHEVPDLLLTDIRMPELDGLQLWSRARTLRPDLVGVFMTAHGSIDTVIKSLQLGISGFLLKPFTGSELDRAVRDALQKHRQSYEATRMRVLAPLFETRRLFEAEADLATLGRLLVEKVALETRSDYCAVFVPEREAATSEATLKALASFGGPGARSFSPRTFPAPRLARRAMELGRTLSLRPANGTDQLPAGEQIPGAVIVVPFMAGSRAIGSLLVGRAESQRPFSASDREIFEVVAFQLAALLENQRLQASLTERNERLSLVAGRFVSAQEEEKRQLAERIGLELLPALSQTRQNIQSYLQKVRPSSAGELLGAEERLHSLIKEVKQLTHELRPANLDEFGLSAALRQYVRKLTEDGGECQPVFRLEGQEAPRLLPAVEIALFRAAQDALDNACRHAKASSISLTVRLSGPRNRPTRLEIEVRDAGPGFDLQGESSKAGLGLLAMQERVRLVGASCQIISAPGEGTQVLLGYDLPVEP